MGGQAEGRTHIVIIVETQRSCNTCLKPIVCDFRLEREREREREREGYIKTKYM